MIQMKSKKRFKSSFSDYMSFYLCGIIVAFFVYLQINLSSILQGQYYIQALQPYNTEIYNGFLTGFVPQFRVFEIICLTALVIQIVIYFVKKKERRLLSRVIFLIGLLLISIGIILIEPFMQKLIHVSDYNIFNGDVTHLYSLLVLGLLLIVTSLVLQYLLIYRGKRYVFDRIDSNVLNIKLSRKKRVTIAAIVLVSIISVITYHIVQKINPQYIDPFEFVTLEYHENNYFVGDEIETYISPYVSRDYKKISESRLSRIMNFVSYEVNNNEMIRAGDEIIVKAAISEEVASFYNIRLTKHEKKFTVQGLTRAPETIDAIQDAKKIISDIDEKIANDSDYNQDNVSYTKKAVLYSSMKNTPAFNNTFSYGTIVVVYDVEYRNENETYIEPHIFYTTRIIIDREGNRVKAENLLIASETNPNYFKTSDELIETYQSKYNFKKVEG